MIKLIASDLDGTLLTTYKQLTQRLLSVLKKAYEKNIILVPATGRTLTAIPRYVLDIPSAKYIITSNGACVYKNGSAKPIFKECLLPEYAELIFNESNALNAVTEIFADGKAYIDKKQAENLSSYGINGHHAEYIKNTRIVVESLRDTMLKNIDSIENINSIFSDMALRESFRNDMKTKISASVTSSSPNNIEISSLKADKAEALKSLCLMLDIAPSDTIAFGDSENDVSMLSFAGKGVLMSNSDKLLKSDKFEISTSCDNYGVARILEKYI